MATTNFNLKLESLNEIKILRDALEIQQALLKGEFKLVARTRSEAAHELGQLSPETRDGMVIKLRLVENLMKDIG